MRFLYTSVIVFAALFLFSSTSEAATKTDITHTLKFSDGTKVSTLFYPYRDPAVVKPNASRSLQGMTTDEKGNYFISYATGDKTKYGYIYKYNKKFKLTKMSKKLTIGHGQAIDFYKGYIYQIADVVTNKNYTLQKIDPNTLKVVEKWTIPAIVHPNVFAMESDSSLIVVSKINGATAKEGRYDFNRLHIVKGKKELDRFANEKTSVTGLVGTTKGKEVQGFERTEERYYVLSNGQYLSVLHDGTKKKTVKLKTDREPEGMMFTKKGKMLILFNKYNEVFMQK